MSGEKSNFLRIEVPGFATDEYGEPMTSTLRLGAVGVTAQQLDALKQDPGEDLKKRVSGFFDDKRVRCDPPSLDAERDGEALPPSSAAELARMKLELDAARKNADELRRALDAVLPDPDGWAENLMKMRKEAAARVQAERVALSALLTAAGEAQRAGEEKDRRVPPTHSAPGYEETEKDEQAADGDQEAEEEQSSEGPRYSPYVHKVDRRQQSQRLHTLGGWRDHTDGNRITTTRGDKVEVVGGNYRLVVLGRTEEPTDADGHPVLPGWEVSGGHLEQTDVTRVVPETSLSWHRRWNGNWYSVEEQLKGDVKTVTSGDTAEKSFGHHLVTVVGTETPDGPWHAPEDCPGGRCHTNPKIVDHTWAELMDTTTGSEALPIPEIRDQMWVKKMSTGTHAELLHDERSASTQRSVMVADDIVDETSCGTMTTTTTAGTITDHTIAGLRMTRTRSALTLTANVGRTTNDVFGVSTDLFLGARNTVSLAGAADITVARQLSVMIGIKAELTAAASLSLSIEGKKEITVGPQVKNNLGPSVKVAPFISMNGVHIDVG